MFLCCVWCLWKTLSEGKHIEEKEGSLLRMIRRLWRPWPQFSALPYGSCRFDSCREYLNSSSVCESPLELSKTPIAYFDRD